MSNFLKFFLGSGHPLDFFGRGVYFGQSITIALWLCLQSWAQALQSRLYSILPLLLMNMLISNRFFLLILGISNPPLKSVVSGVIFADFFACKA